jgi:hypothetical protein
MDDQEMRDNESVSPSDFETILLKEKIIDLKQNTLVVEWMISVLKEIDLTIEAAKSRQ